MKYINRYTFFARYLPGLISILPVTLLYFFLTKKYSNYDLQEYFQSLTFIMGISVSFLVSFLAGTIVKELGSSLERKYFNGRLEFPTNTMLLFEDQKLPKKVKEKYGHKIYSDYELTRLSEAKEKNDKVEALKVLQQASRFLCAKYQQHSQVKDANIAYGLVRNLSGGLWISLPTSILGVIAAIIFKEKSLLVWSIISTIIFAFLFFFHKKWIRENAEKFAHKIITVYLADNNSKN